MSSIKDHAMRKLRSGLIGLGIDPSALRRRLLPNDRTFDECELVHAWFRTETVDSGLMIDVGVAWGSAAKPFLDDGWSVHGFEPDISASKAERIAALGQYPRFHLYPNAVSSVSGEELDFYQSAESEGISSLHDFRDHDLSHKVTTVALDDFFQKNEISKVDFLKIDVEGHEQWVLDGLDFGNVAPEVLVLEFDDQKTVPLGYDWKDLAERLTREGYSIFTSEWYPIENYGSLHRFRSITDYPNDLQDSNGWGNLIAVRTGRSASFRNFVQTTMKHRFLRSI